MRDAAQIAQHLIKLFLMFINNKLLVIVNSHPQPIEIFAGQDRDFFRACA
jgi:hypothetical protein